MKQISTLFKVLLAIFFLQNLSAQVPNDFEFLDHRARTSFHMESTILGDKLVSVQGLSTQPMTSVNLVDMETNKIDTILGTFGCQSELREFSDGTFDIYLYHFFDYDVIVSGYIHVAYDGNEFSVDTLHSFYFSEPDVDTHVYPNSIIENKNGGHYIIGNDSLYISDGVSLTSLRNASSNHKLFQNDAGDEFLYRGQHLVKILDNGNAFDTIQIIVDRAIEINNNGQYNDILTHLDVQRWNDDFTQLLKTWTLPEPLDSFSPQQLQSFYKIHVGDSLLTLLYNRDDGYEFITVTEEGDEDVSIGSYDNEEFVGFHLLSDNRRLAIHQYEVPEIESSQLLYRHVDDLIDIEYDKRQVSMDSFSVVLLNSDTIDVFVTSSGDTLYFVGQSFDVDFKYTNNSDTSISHVNVLSSEVLSDYYYLDMALNYTFDNLMQPSESVTIDTSYYTQYGIPQVVSMAIPGADYRINDDSNRIFTTDVVLDIAKVVFDKSIKIFPNPTGDLINVESEERIVELAIYNAQGQLMMFKGGQADLNTVNVQELNPGTYFIKLRLDKQNTYGIQQFMKL